MDNKPLLPPAYNTVPGAYDYQQPQAGYGAIPQPAPAPAAFPQPPPPYPFPAAQGYPSAPAHPAATGTPASTSNTYTIIQPSVVVVGGCPACRVGVLEEDFTCLGIMCAIFFFPLGIIFCLALRQRRCPNCGATFG
ncbi:membrane protein BRI3 [Clarias gariepinus]|uniref:brain protein I3 n=1 Tax=Clarias gariepinus TaxID=13013 RepID=UPI00234D91E7|nr:brain protein I3 [Clarias gariepinus]